MQQREIIYNKDNLKILLCAQGERLRKVSFRDGKVIGEYLYFRVRDTGKIQKINDRSINWSVRSLSGTYGYIILEQKDAYEKLTGYCKIIKRDQAIIVEHLFRKPDVLARNPDRAWMYYERRG